MATTAEALALAFEHHEAGRFGPAEEIYRRILASEPHQAEVCARLGALCIQTNRAAEAVARLEAAVAIEPTVAEYQTNLGAAYLVMARFDDALAAFQRAIVLDPGLIDAHYNLGVVLTARERPDEAEASYRRCLELRSGHAWALNNLGELAQQRGNFDEALEYLEQAVASDPELVSARYNRALVWLALARFDKGWQEFEWRFRLDGFEGPQFTQPVWDGSPLGDKTLLVHAEQGFGDMLQFVRYLPLVQARCRRVVVEVPGQLLPLLEQSSFRGLVRRGPPLPHFDVQLPLLSLGRVFATTLDTIPSQVPYLKAKPELIASWRDELARFDGFKVGIAWQGRTSFRGDRYRSIALAQFAPLARLRGVRLFGLQKGPGSEQIVTIRGTFPVVDLGSRIDEGSGPFMDTAAIMENLDLVITSDTAVAHLAGGLGAKVWLALAAGADWRWLVGRTDSPWYPSMRLFRQRTAGNWTEVFDSMASELARLTGN